ncbi:Uncharacterised protein [Afipia felis]|uniref:Uncharacterized protein n=2 Tax=Afipia felis TaxID=1035 RepID=A0A380W5N1_AFIFE|nr:hypothetical protein HMPREF9697_04037 [Afipia felis ATCC 53690]SUU76155.1 Uncharacterised protein [Afipia felis]SUU84222.1 Uncharacterised protein [Afipia felis]SUW28206.1 Uncharacterised protein [Afipia felis]
MYCATCDRTENNELALILKTCPRCGGILRRPRSGDDPRPPADQAVLRAARAQ